MPLHTDFNDANVLASSAKSGKISGVIDFGDSVRSWRVNDIAIAVAYLFVMLHRSKPPMKTDGFSSKDSPNLAIEAMSYFMEGVTRVYELSALEVSLIQFLLLVVSPSRVRWEVIPSLWIPQTNISRNMLSQHGTHCVQYVSVSATFVRH